MKKFEVGKTYYSRSICDNECIFTIKVVKRTEKSVTYIYEGKQRRSMIKMDENGEYIKPDRHSMAPTFRAERLYEGLKKYKVKAGCLVDEGWVTWEIEAESEEAAWEVEAEAREAAEFEREKAEKPGELLMRVSAHNHNASAMKNCMKAARDAANYLRNKENDVDDWQIAGINAMFDQCDKESIVPYDLPYAINGLLLQWSRATVGAGAMLEAVKE